MKSRWMLLALGLAMLLMTKGIIAAEEEAKKEKNFEATCPVSGKPAGEDHVVVRKNGGRTEKIYFCCDNCPKAYKEDPKKFRLQVNRQLFETGQMVQVACPLTGKPLNKEAKAEAGTAEVAFCCEKCLAHYTDASDEEKLKLVFSNAALKKGFTKQTKCPVSGKDINPEQSADYEGRKVYFCCPNCKAAFEKDPEKYAAKLPKARGNKDKEKKASS
jgi:YHS domain-containing protein